jgi:hypothetical protein
MMILNPHPVELPTNRGQPIRGNSRVVASEATVAAVNEIASAVASEASPAASEATARLVNSPNAERIARRVRDQIPRAINERGKTEVENNTAMNNTAEANKALSEALAEPQSDRLKVIAPTRAAVRLVAATPAKAASNPLVDLNVHNRRLPSHQGEPPPMRLTLPAQPPKANQQKRNRCQIGNALPPCLDLKAANQKNPRQNPAKASRVESSHQLPSRWLTYSPQPNYRKSEHHAL